MSTEAQVRSTGSKRGSAHAPQLAIPPIEIPEGIRQLTASSVNQMKVSCERMMFSTEAFTGACERACSIATKNTADLTAKMVDALRANTSEAFDFTADLLAAKSLPEMIEVTIVHTRKQLDSISAQSREFWSLGQRLMAETAKPVSSELSKTFDTGAAS